MPLPLNLVLLLQLVFRLSLDYMVEVSLQLKNFGVFVLGDYIWKITLLFHFSTRLFDLAKAASKEGLSLLKAFSVRLQLAFVKVTMWLKYGAVPVEIIHSLTLGHLLLTLYSFGVSRTLKYGPWPLALVGLARFLDFRWHLPLSQRLPRLGTNKLDAEHSSTLVLRTH